MATVPVVIPDALITYYNTALASWNAYIIGQGGSPIPPPTAATIQRIIKDLMKSRTIGEAFRTGMVPADLEALQTALAAL